MTEIVPTIAARAIGKLLETLPGLGVDAAATCREAGFDPAVAADPQARVPLEQLYRLWEAVLARLDRPDAALFLAERFTASDYGLLGFVCASAGTLGEALGHVSRYLALWATEPAVRISGGARLDVVYRRPVPDRPGLRLANEATLAEILNAARVLTQRPDFAPVEVSFEHPAPADPAAHRAFFRAPVRFGGGATRMVFTAEQLSAPLPRADPQLAAFLRGLAEQALAKAVPASSLIEALRRQIAAALTKGMPELAGVARSMAMSERTLRRRLEEEGTSFRDLLDGTRATLAREYLRDKALALSEVAFLLGFSEPSAFHRAFKRWTDTTPSAWRARATIK